MMRRPFTQGFAFSLVLVGMLFFVPSTASAAPTDYDVLKLENTDVRTLVSECTGIKVEKATWSAIDVLDAYIGDTKSQTCKKTVQSRGTAFAVQCTSSHSTSEGNVIPGECRIDGPDTSFMRVAEGYIAGGKFKTYAPGAKESDAPAGRSDSGLNPSETGVNKGKDFGGAATAEAERCGFGDIGCNLVQAGKWLMKRIALFLLFLAAFFAGFGGYLFNQIIYITVFQFGNLIGNNPGMLAAWGVLRDIGNIILLFGFIFMGVSTILNLPGNEFTARRALPALIIFAILMNFSLFAAEAVIDTSNAFGSTLYRQASSGFCDPGEGVVDCVTQKGIGGKIMQISGIAAIFKLDPNQDPNEIQIGTSDIGALIEILGLTIFAAVTAFVFFAAVFMFVTRAVMLAFLMAVSPIGFAGMAIPPLHHYASMWWDQLLKQSFFAPIYILLILISIKFMEGIIVALNAAAASESTTDIPTLASAFSQSGITNVSMVVNFLLITGFMLGGLIIAKSMGAAGANGATRMAGSIVFGGMARAGNLGIGGGSRLLRYGVQNTLGRSQNRFLRGIGSGASAFLKGGENLNTDLRQVAPGKLQELTGKPSDHGATYSGIQHIVHEVGDDIRKNQAAFDRDTSLQKLRRELDDKELSAESERFLSTLSAEEIAKDHDLEHNIEKLATKVSTGQFDGLMRSDKVPQRLKDEARRARFTELEDAVKKSFKGGIRKMSPADLEQFFQSPVYAELAEKNPEALKEFVTLMNQGQYDALRASKSLTNNQRRDIKRWRDDDRFNFNEFNQLRDFKAGKPGATAPVFEQAVSMDGKRQLLFVDPKTGRLTTTNTGIKATRLDRTLNDNNTRDLANLDDKILAREEVYTRLAPEVFAAMQTNNKLEPDQRVGVNEYLKKVLENDAHPKHALFQAYIDSMGDSQWKNMRAYYRLFDVKRTSEKTAGTTGAAGSTAAGGGGAGKGGGRKK